MKRFGLGLLAAGMLAAAALATSLPASARGGGTIWIPPMGGGMGGGGMGGDIGEWHGGGSAVRPPTGGWNRPPNGNWHAPGGVNGYPGKPTQGWNNHNNWYHNGHWYGPRYRYRYPGFNYYYGGFWYPWAWWNNGWNEIGDNYGYPGYYGGYAPRLGSRHVAWCQGRYRSYNVRTNTYIGYDGLQHRCNSPFD